MEKELISNKYYWFTDNVHIYYGLYEGEPDRFVINNYYLKMIKNTKTKELFKNIKWSVNKNNIFETKEECIERYKKIYKELYTEEEFNDKMKEIIEVEE